MLRGVRPLCKSDLSNHIGISQFCGTTAPPIRRIHLAFRTRRPLNKPATLPHPLQHPKPPLHLARNGDRTATLCKRLPSGLPFNTAPANPPDGTYKSGRWRERLRC